VYFDKYIWLIYFYENWTMKLVEIVLRMGGGGWGRMMIRWL
jgi:hypothetical protein